MTYRRPIGGLLLIFALQASSLALAAPVPSGLTAAVSPTLPIVGVTKVTIVGTAGAGHQIVDTSTFPDGTVHTFSVTADDRGTYTDGPFVLPQIGTYQDVLRDEATGATTSITYPGGGDFDITAGRTNETVIAGAEAKFRVTFKSVSGFAGWVVPSVLDDTKVPGAVLSWSLPSVKVPSDGSASATLTIITLQTTPVGSYDLTFQGANGPTTHRAEAVTLTVTGPPPNAITAAFHPDNPVVGVSEVRITGTVSNGEWVTDTSTFPDGSVHQFTFKSNGQGAYVDGPFVLKQLGTYQDLLTDAGTGGTTAISYQGVGDFSAALDDQDRTIRPGQDVQFGATFKSLSGFIGTIALAAPDLSELPGATATWSPASVSVRPGVSAVSRLHITTSNATPAGRFKLAVEGRNGSVTHAAPDISLTILPP